MCADTPSRWAIGNLSAARSLDRSYTALRSACQKSSDFPLPKVPPAICDIMHPSPKGGGPSSDFALPSVLTSVGYGWSRPLVGRPGDLIPLAPFSDAEKGERSPNGELEVHGVNPRPIRDFFRSCFACRFDQPRPPLCTCTDSPSLRRRWVGVRLSGPTRVVMGHPLPSSCWIARDDRHTPLQSAPAPHRSGCAPLRS